MSNLRILHLIHGLTVGGAEVDLLNKAVALSHDYGCQLTIGCLMRRGELAPQAEAAGITVVGPLMRHRYDVRAGPAVRRLLLSQPWDILHTHLFAANFVGWATLLTIGPAKRPLLLAAEHAMAPRWNQTTLLLDKLIQRQAAAILVPSETARQSYLTAGLNGGKLKVLSNAIDATRFEGIDRVTARARLRAELGLPAGTLLAGTVCRLEPVKGLPVLIEAIRSIESPPLHLIIAGDGSQRAHLEALIRQRGLADRVHLLGNQSDIPTLLGGLDLFVLHSYSESFGIAVAEAILMQLPIIATEVGAIGEITGHGAYARLVPPGDSRELANAIRQTLIQPEANLNKTRQGATTIKLKMSLPATVKEQYELYQSLIANN